MLNQIRMYQQRFGKWIVVSIGSIIVTVITGYVVHFFDAPPLVIVIAPDWIVILIALVITLVSGIICVFHVFHVHRILEEYKIDFQNERKSDYSYLYTEVGSMQKLHYDNEHEVFRKTIISECQSLKKELDILKSQLGETS